MNLVIDTCAFISLENVNLTSKILQYFDIYITDTIASELSDMAQYKDKSANSAKRILELIENNQIELRNIKDFSSHLVAVDAGEASCLSLAITEKVDYLVTDDCRCFGYLSERFKNTVFSIFLVKLLLNLREITDEEGWSYIEKMRETRTWGNNMIYRKAKLLWNK